MRHRTTSSILAVLLTLAAAPGATAQDPTHLADLIRSGNVRGAMALLDEGASGESAGLDGTTALHWAVQLDDGPLVHALLDAGARVDVANRYGVSPLAVAALNGSRPMVERLLDEGADPNQASDTGETPLMSAARSGNPETIRLLLSGGADPNASEHMFGETALMWAAGYDRGEAIHALVEGGANPDAISSTIELPEVPVDFSFAVGTALPRGGMTALMYAARQGQINAVTALADAGADLDIVDPEGATAIVIAIINAHFEVAARLAEKGADPNIADDAGMGALYAAVDMANPWSFVNRPSPTPTGSLSAAELVRVLLDHGADPNQALNAPLLMRQHNSGDRALGAGATPLARAAKTADLGMMRLLLEHGAEPSAALADGSTAVTMALSGRGARTLTADSAMFESVRLLLESGYDVNAVDDQGQTLLHRNVDRGEAFVRMLLAHGARLDLQDASGRTALDIALGVGTPTPEAGGGRGGAFGRGGGGGAAPISVDDATIALLTAADTSGDDR